MAWTTDEKNELTVEDLHYSDEHFPLLAGPIKARIAVLVAVLNGTNVGGTQTSILLVIVGQMVRPHRAGQKKKVPVCTFTTEIIYSNLKILIQTCLRCRLS